MPVQRLICFALAMLTSACAVRAPRYELREPPLPFEDHGACPFECCTYRDWTVETMTELHAARSLQAPVVFSVKPGEKVVGLNGVVVTRKPGRAVVVDHIELEGSPRAPSVTLKPGDLVHIIHYEGEGNWLCWFQGQLLSLWLPDTPGGFRSVSHEPDPIRVERWPEVVWWVKVRNAHGDQGWTNSPDHFGNVDACS